MKKINLGQALNTIANLGVIAGIVFLALELRQTQELTRAQTRTEMFLAEQEDTRFDIESPVMEILNRRGSGEAISGVDQGRIGAWGNMRIRRLNHKAYLAARGLYEVDEFEAELMNNVGLLAAQNEMRLAFCRRWPDRFEPILVAMAETVRSEIEEACE